VISRINSVPITLRFYDAVNHAELDPTLLLAPGQDLSHLIQGQLLGVRDEAGNQPAEDLVFHLADDPDGGGTVLVADAGSQFAHEGTYQVVLQANPDALNENYLLPKESSNVTFLRQDSPTTKPGTCNMTLTGLGIFLALVFVALSFAFTGGPGGTLVGVDHNQQVLYSVRLSHARAFSTVRNNKMLAEKGIGTIKAKKVKREDKKRAVEVEITASNGDTLFTGTLVVNEPPEFYQTDEGIRYE
jgi:hypothetical protein